MLSLLFHLFHSSVLVIGDSDLFVKHLDFHDLCVELLVLLLLFL